MTAQAVAGRRRCADRGYRTRLGPRHTSDRHRESTFSRSRPRPREHQQASPTASPPRLAGLLAARTEAPASRRGRRRDSRPRPSRLAWALLGHRPTPLVLKSSEWAALDAGQPARPPARPRPHRPRRGERRPCGPPPSARSRAGTPRIPPQVRRHPAAGPATAGPVRDRPRPRRRRRVACRRRPGHRCPPARLCDGQSADHRASWLFPAPPDPAGSGSAASSDTMRMTLTDTALAISGPPPSRPCSVRGPTARPPSRSPSLHALGFPWSSPRTSPTRGGRILIRSAERTEPIDVLPCAGSMRPPPDPSTLRPDSRLGRRPGSRRVGAG